jgi:hypothetical protein
MSRQDVIQTDEDREAEDEIDTGGYISIPGSQIPESLLLGQDYVDEVRGMRKLSICNLI